jgi:hypothetical protein
MSAATAATSSMPGHPSGSSGSIHATGGAKRAISGRAVARTSRPPNIAYHTAPTAAAESERLRIASVNTDHAPTQIYLAHAI